MVTKTIEELDHMKLLIQKGELPPDAIKQYFADEEKIVFGHDFKKVKGKPVEQGIGAPGKETDNHFRSIAKYEGVEAEKAARAAAAARKKKAE